MGGSVGSEDDTTSYALYAEDHSSIAALQAVPVIHGHVRSNYRSFLSISSTTIDGDVFVDVCSDAVFLGSMITDHIYCSLGGDVRCNFATAQAGVVGCPSTTCGFTAASPSSRPKLPSPELDLPTVRIPDPRPPVWVPGAK